MELITTKAMVDGVAEAWKRQYHCTATGEWSDVYGGFTSEQIYNALVALPKTAGEEEVAQIIGNDSWTGIFCDECGYKVDAAVMMGDPPGHDSRTVYLCVNCLRQALELIESEK